MYKQRTPEEIAKELEEIDFAEIEDVDLKEVFGGSELPDDHCNRDCGTNTNCGCGEID